MKTKINNTNAWMAFFVVIGLSGCGGSTEDETVSNQAPIISSSNINVAATGTLYSYTFTANDSDSEVLTLSASALPSWLNFDATSGVLIPREFLLEAIVYKVCGNIIDKLVWMFIVCLSLTLHGY